MAAVLLAVVTLAVAGCTAHAGVPGGPVGGARPAPSRVVALPRPVPAAPAPTTTTPTNPAGTVPVPAPNELAGEFFALQSDMHGSVGLALMPVGSNHVITMGSWSSGIAWSTIKVPLALAALRKDPALTDTAAAAITTSDNDAAQALWQALGGGNQAAEAVETVLHEAGDTTTDVSNRRSPAPNQSVDDQLSFGGTEWTLLEQVRFAARLPCLQQAARVVDLMGQITESQSWGLGSVLGAQFKGGWGPDDQTGAYLVRQFGLIPTWSGGMAVAMAAQPDSGTFEDGTAMVDKLASLLAHHIQELRGGHCI